MFAISKAITLGGIGLLLAGVGAVLSGWAAMRMARKRNGNHQPKEP